MNISFLQPSVLVSECVWLSDEGPKVWDHVDSFWYCHENLEKGWKFEDSGNKRKKEVRSRFLWVFQRNQIGCIQSTIRQSQSDNTIRRSTCFNASGRLRSTWISQWMTENESCLLTNSILRRRSIRTSGETTTQQYFKPTVNHGSGKVSELDTWTELIPQW